MNNNPKLQNELKEILKSKAKEIEASTIDKISNCFNKFNSSFNSFFKLLCDENIIKEDPYKEEYSLKSLELPDSSSISYNEEDYQMTIRLSHYQALLTYIKEEVTFSIDYLTPPIIEKIEQLVKFIDWYRLFDPQPIGENTVALNKVLFMYIKDIGHRHVISTLKSSTRNVDIYSKEFLTILNKVKLFQSETYKQSIREAVIPTIKLPPVLQGENIRKAHDMISKKVKESGLPLYINLIGELLKEDYSPDGEKIIKEIIENLNNSEEEKSDEKIKEKKVTTKSLLENTLTELYKFSSQINSVIIKTNENCVYYRDEKFSIFEKILDYIKHSIFLSKRETKYCLKITCEKDQKPKEKEVELEKFLTSLNSLSRTFENYKNREQLDFLELFSKSEDEIQIFIHQLISKSRHNHKILSALDKFYKKELTGAKGIQVELKVMLSVLNRSQALYQEFIKLKEENQNSLLKRGVQT